MGGFLQPEWCVSTTFDIIYFTNIHGPYKRRKFRGEHLIKFTAISYEIDCFSLAPLLPLSPLSLPQTSCLQLSPPSNQIKLRQMDDGPSTTMRDGSDRRMPHTCPISDMIAAPGFTLDSSAIFFIPSLCEVSTGSCTLKSE